MADLSLVQQIQLAAANGGMGVGFGVMSSVIMTLLARRTSRRADFEKVRDEGIQAYVQAKVEAGEISAIDYYKCRNVLDVATLASKYEDEKQAEGRGCGNDAEPRQFDFDWYVRFYEVAGCVSDVDMQDVYARVLASRTLGKHGVSLRTLQVLSNLSSQEVALFTEAARHFVVEQPKAYSSMGLSMLVVDDTTARLSGEDVPICARYGIPGITQQILSDCGLVAQTFVTIDASSSYDFSIGDERVSVSWSYSSNAMSHRYRHPAHTMMPLTEAGRSMYEILGIAMSDYSRLLLYSLECVSYGRARDVTVYFDGLRPGGLNPGSGRLFHVDVPQEKVLPRDLNHLRRKVIRMSYDIKAGRT